MLWVPAIPDAAKSRGSCSPCCKLFDVDWLEKPKPVGQWCHHCRPGWGCAIWQNLPQKCGDHHCVWRLDPGLGPEWKPERAGFILTHAHQDAPLAVILEPTAPDAHRREPYASALRETARRHLEGRGSTIVVFCRKRRSLIFPDHEIEIPDGVALNDVRMNRAGEVFWRAEFANA